MAENVLKRSGGRGYRCTVVAIVLATLPLFAEAQSSALAAPAGIPSDGQRAFGSNVPPIAAPSAASRDTIPAFTEPSVRADLTFAIPSSTPSLVVEVRVKEGDRVKAGDLLVQLDDRAERAQLRALESEITNLRVEAAEKDLAQKRVDFGRKEKLYNDGRSASQSEYDEAKLAVELREIQVGIEKQTLEGKKAQVDQQRTRVEQLSLRSPIDGIVERLDLVPGEAPETQRASVIVVNNSPLWVNVMVPSATALKWKTGDKVQMTYTDTTTLVEGKIIFMGSVVDAASDLRRVKLEVANPSDMPAGLGVNVLTGQESTAAAVNRG